MVMGVRKKKVSIQAASFDIRLHVGRYGEHKENRFVVSAVAPVFGPGGAPTPGAHCHSLCVHERSPPASNTSICRSRMQVFDDFDAGIALRLSAK